MRKKLITIGVVLALAGCAGYGQVKKTVAEQGAKAEDEKLEAAEWYFCNAASVGSVKRRYKTPEEVEAYNTICGDRLP